MAYINPEFAWIQEEEARQTQNAGKPGIGAETGVVIGVENLPDSAKRLLDKNRSDKKENMTKLILAIEADKPLE